jgi:hypothetical protein
MVDAGTADYSQGTANFWDDNQLQVVLDRHRMDVYREGLHPIPDQLSGSLSWKEYRSHYVNLEATDGGSAVFIVEDSVGNNQGTANWSVDYRRGIVTFGSDQRGTAYYLTSRSYDLNGAAGEIWRMKAGHASKQYAFSTDGHSFQRNQILDHCMKMASYYESRGKVETVQIFRSDLT